MNMINQSTEEMILDQPTKYLKHLFELIQNIVCSAFISRYHWILLYLVFNLILIMFKMNVLYKCEMSEPELNAAYK